MKYMLFYTEGCSPDIRYFETFREAETWAGQFLLKNSQNTDDNWIDMIVRGRIKAKYSDWATSIEEVSSTEGEEK